MHIVICILVSIPQMVQLQGYFCSCERNFILCFNPTNGTITSSSKFHAPLNRLRFNPTNGTITRSLIAGEMISENCFNPTNGTITRPLLLRLDLAYLRFQSHKWYNYKSPKPKGTTRYLCCFNPTNGTITRAQNPKEQHDIYAVSIPQMVQLQGYLLFLSVFPPPFQSHKWYNYKINRNSSSFYFYLFQSHKWYNYKLIHFIHLKRINLVSIPQMVQLQGQTARGFFKADTSFNPTNGTITSFIYPLVICLILLFQSHKWYNYKAAIILFFW